MRKAFVVFLSIIGVSLSLQANSETKIIKPMANWGVYAIATSGGTYYEGKKLRAVLIYGEIGEPYLYIESISVAMGYPVQSEVLWRKKLDVAGGKRVCPVSETWCGKVVNLRWDEQLLKYEIKAGIQSTYYCTAKGSKDKNITTICLSANEIENKS